MSVNEQGLRSRGVLSVVIPVFNEEGSLALIHEQFQRVLSTLDREHELIFVNDGSSDGSLAVLHKLVILDGRIRIVNLSRNFGKEVALTAGLHASTGCAVVTIDGDGQHPVAVIPLLVAEWEAGADVVIGVREGSSGQTLLKRLSSWGYYRVLNSIAEYPTVPRSTDFRLLDRQVVDAFACLTERNRITRGLIDWLGFKRSHVYFQADLRAQGAASYSLRRLVRLALDSFVSSSLFPLKLAGYVGSLIMLASLLLTTFLGIERFALGDPMHLAISGTAFLALLLLFLVGVILCCLGLMALYVASIHTEVLNRPLYIVRDDNSLQGGARRTEPALRKR